MTPIYLAFKLYVDHSGEVSLRTRSEVETYKADKIGADRQTEIGINRVPYLDFSATFNEKQGILYIATVNRHKEKDIKCRVELRGFTPQRKGRIYELNAEEASSANNFDIPDNVKIVEKTFNEKDNQFDYTFPRHSVTVLELI